VNCIEEENWVKGVGLLIDWLSEALLERGLWKELVFEAQRRHWEEQRESSAHYL